MGFYVQYIDKITFINKKSNYTTTHQPIREDTNISVEIFFLINHKNSKKNQKTYTIYPKIFIFALTIKLTSITMTKSTSQSKDVLSFDRSYAELERISKELENAEISVDLMSDYAKECLPLVRTCKEKLTLTQNDIDLLVKELDDDK